MSDYGWLITDGNAEYELNMDIGTAGPEDISTDHYRDLHGGKGEAFKMYDDDGEWYYTGLIIGDYEGLEPLDDFGTPNAGAVDIEIKRNGTWERI